MKEYEWYLTSLAKLLVRKIKLETFINWKLQRLTFHREMPGKILQYFLKRWINFQFKNLPSELITNSATAKTYLQLTFKKFIYHFAKIVRDEIMYKNFSGESCNCADLSKVFPIFEPSTNAYLYC